MIPHITSIYFVLRVSDFGFRVWGLGFINSFINILVYFWLIAILFLSRGFWI